MRSLEKQAGVAWSVRDVSSDSEPTTVHQQMSAGDYSRAGTRAVAILFSAIKSADMDLTSRKEFVNSLLCVMVQDIDSAVTDVLPS